MTNNTSSDAADNDRYAGVHWEVNEFAVKELELRDPEAAKQFRDFVAVLKRNTK